MKYLILLTLLSISTHISIAQCNTRILDQEGFTTIYGAEYEHLFSIVGHNDNGDYGQGTYFVAGQLIRYKAKQQDIVINMWVLNVTVKATYFTSMTPREITIKFANGSVIRAKPRSINHHQGHFIGDFDINENDIVKFSSAISEITVTDLNKSITKKPLNAYLLAQQKRCLNKL